MLMLIDGICVVAGFIMLIGGILTIKDAITKSYYGKSFIESIVIIFLGGIIILLWLVNI